jgi:hypothetical protein
MESDEILESVTAGILQPRGGVESSIGHWSQLLEGLRASPQDFYAAVDAAIQRREIPDCRLSRTDWREGGLISAKREYLRAERGDYLIDICGAPFGNAFFVSSWLCTPPPNLFKAALMVLGGLLFGGWLVNDLSIIRSALLLLDLFFILGVVIFGILRPIYFPPRLTYYRVDTAEMFYQAVHQAVLEVIDGLSSAQGLRLLSGDERKPIMRGFSR